MRRPKLPRLPKRVRYPVWSVKTITAVAVFVLGVTAASVFLLGKRSVFAETELTLAIAAAALFVFLTVGLYRGVRVKRKDLPGVPVEGLEFADIGQHLPDGIDFSDGIDGDAEGCVGAIVGLLVAIFAGILLILLLWVLLNVGIVVWVFLLAALAWVFYLALRQVFARSRACKGKLGPSLGWAAWYTFLYTGWLFGLVWAAHRILGPGLGERAAVQSEAVER